MRGNRRIAVFAFTRAYGEQKFYKRLEQEGWETALTACENLEGTNCYCGEAAAEALRERIQAFGLSGIHFLDSGNYHYVSRLWLEQAEEKAFRIVYSDAARNRIGWIRENGGPDLENFCSVQLTLDPFNRKRKRLERDSEGNWRIGCRTWQVVFHAEEKRIFVTSVLSHYSSGELAEVEDRYGDKKLHREFRRVFPNE